eukprot:GHVT01048551.1.p2 GENE.GHVT01048551.1~~GHVT01048551.1.p2  ORF type:complete len:217 (+),score=29.97 GHVT01048551.1:68-718(+)
MAPSLLSDFIFKALPSAALFGSSSPSVPSSLSDSEYKSSRSAAVAGSSSPPVLNKLSHAHIVTAFLPYSSLSSLSVPDFSSVSFISCAGSDSSFVSNIFSIAFISSSELAAGSRSAHSDSAANFDGCCCSSLWRSGQVGTSHHKRTLRPIDLHVGVARLPLGSRSLGADVVALMLGPSHGSSLVCSSPPEPFNDRPPLVYAVATMVAIDDDLAPRY